MKTNLFNTHFPTNSKIKFQNDSFNITSTLQNIKLQYTRNLITYQFNCNQKKCQQALHYQYSKNTFLELILQNTKPKLLVGHLFKINRFQSNLNLVFNVGFHSNTLKTNLSKKLDNYKFKFNMEFKEFIPKSVKSTINYNNGSEQCILRFSNKNQRFTQELTLVKQQTPKFQYGINIHKGGTFNIAVGIQYQQNDVCFSLMQDFKKLKMKMSQNLDKNFEWTIGCQFSRHWQQWPFSFELSLNQ